MTEGPTFRDMSDFLFGLTDRCFMADGSVAGEAILRVDQSDVVKLQTVAAELRDFGVYEKEIRLMFAPKKSKSRFGRATR